MKSRKSIRLLLITPVLVLMIASCGKSPYIPDYSAAPPPFDTTGAPKTVQSDGLIYYDVKKGSGPYTVVEDDIIQIKYTGRKKKDGSIFASTYEKQQLGSPYYASVGGVDATGNFTLIRGLREGLLGMKKGGERVIVVPPDLAYAGTTNALAPDTLVYDVQLIEFVGY